MTSQTSLPLLKIKPSGEGFKTFKAPKDKL